jgi:hypothetical protein
MLLVIEEIDYSQIKDGFRNHASSIRNIITTKITKNVILFNRMAVRTFSKSSSVELPWINI